MKRMLNLVLAVSSLLVSPQIVAAPGQYTESEKPVLLAQAKKKKPAASGNVREKFISREATLKSRDQKNLDFDAVDIGGQRKTPMGTLINQNKADKEYDFVKIRLRWHPEMVQSASSLDYAK